MRAIVSIDLLHGAMRVRPMYWGAVTPGWWYDGVPLLKLSDAGVASGEMARNADSAHDFGAERPLRDISDGIDRFFIRPARTKNLQHMAKLTPPSVLKLRVASDELGAQVYTRHRLGGAFEAWGGICVERSGDRNAVNQPHFPSVFGTLSSPYAQKLVLGIHP